MIETSREVCRNAIVRAMPPDVWEQNEKFTRDLRQTIQAHGLLAHPLLAALGSASLDVGPLKLLHLEFRYTFAQTFTDALLQAMVLCSNLEPRLGAVGKMAARFLLQFNVLDELGFRAEGSAYGGSPHLGHYMKFNETLAQLGVSEAEARRYVPSDAAVAGRRMIEGAYGDLVLLLSILAVEETVFESFAAPWAGNMKKRTATDTDHGYHSIHVKHDGESLDDNHAEDLWYVLRLALEPSRYDDVRAKTMECLDTLVRFVDNLAAAASA